MAAEVRREGRLGDGMLITASVRARLVGMKILELDADVAVSPTPPRMTVRRAVPGERRRAVRAESRAGANGSIGSGLDDAARSLETTVGELAAARRRMP